MKKALKLLSAILCLAMVFSMFAALPTSAEESAKNLIQNSNFTLTDAGKISGWNFDSNYDQDSYTVETDEDGSSVLVIDKVSQDHNFNLGTTAITNLSANKFYKLSVWIKMDSNSRGTYTFVESWASTSVLLKEQSSTRYNITNISPTADIKGVWKEYSIIINGENFYTEENSYTELSLYTKGTACKFYIKNPSIVEYNPDVVDKVAKIETSNLISNSDFSQYDSTAENKFTGFTISGKGTYVLNHEQVNVDLNGSETTAAKITYQKQSANLAQTAYFSPKIDKTKNYRIGAWVKLTNADVYDAETQTWVDGTTWNTDGSVSLFVAKQNDQDSPYRQTLAFAKTKGEWQYLSMTVSSEWISNTWDNKIRVGVRVYACALNVYVTGITIEEFVGDVSVVNAENVVPNGDYEIYDEANNKFDGWSYWNGNSSKNLMSRGEGVSGNAYLFSSANTNGCPSSSKTITIDPTKLYTASVMVKVENSSVSNNFGYAAWGGGIRMEIKDSTETVSVKTAIISKKTDGWVKLSVDIPELPSNAKSLTITLAIGATMANVYFDDVTVLPILGGSITANRANAKSGDTVIVTVNPDWGKKLAENGLTYSAKGATENVAITENKSDVYTLVTGADGVERKVYTSVASDNPNIYQFAMPQNADIVISAVFEDIALIAGDIDWNGSVNVLDIVRLKKHLGGLEVQINLDNAALESETAEIDGLDLAALRQILLGIN